MPADSGVSNRILVACADPPERLDRYCTARNPLELKSILARHADTLDLAVVFTDFNLSTELAEQMDQTLPYILVDHWRDGRQFIEPPGIGLLLSHLSYFDRIAVLQESRWKQWCAQYDLLPINREPWLHTGSVGVLEEIIFKGTPETSRSSETVAHQAEQGASAPELTEFDLRRLKTVHRTESALIRNFLDDLTTEMHNPGQLQLLEYHPGNGRWCHTLRSQLRYSALSDQMQVINQLRRDFPDQRIWSLAELQRQAGREHFDVLLSVDSVNVGNSDDDNQLRSLLSLARDGTRLLLLEDFGINTLGDVGQRLTIRAFEERLWEATQGQLLIDRCEIVRYPDADSVHTRALLQLQWMGRA